MKVGIIGMGTVGQAQSRLFAEHEQVTYDPAHDHHYPLTRLGACDFAVVCVGTPARPGGSCDLSQVRAALRALPAYVPVMLRSTVPPGTTARLQDVRPGHLAHVPEFLHERPGGAWKECADVPFLILGGDKHARAFFRPVLAAVHPGTIHCCTATEAELIKYTANLHSAVRVTFVNEMAGICAAFGANWEDVRAGWLEDANVSADYTAMDGFPPGFGGACWPKDLTALIAAAEEQGCTPWFLRDLREANKRFTSEAESPPGA